MINDKLIKVMEEVRKTVETALALRAENGISPTTLNKLTIYYQLKIGSSKLLR